MIMLTTSWLYGFDLVFTLKYTYCSLGSQFNFLFIQKNRLQSSFYSYGRYNGLIRERTKVTCFLRSLCIDYKKKATCLVNFSNCSLVNNKTVTDFVQTVWHCTFGCGKNITISRENETEIEGFQRYPQALFLQDVTRVHCLTCIFSILYV